jgi:hypothetical protein
VDDEALRHACRPRARNLPEFLPRNALAIRGSAFGGLSDLRWYDYILDRDEAYD